jgi:hypothetical protein
MPRNDQVVLGAGVLALIASFFPFYGLSVSAGGLGSYSASINAWHSYGTVGVLLVIIATLVAAAQVFSASSLPEVPVSLNFVVAGAAALGTLLIILRAFTYKTVSGVGGSVGLKWGAYVLMVICVIQVAFAVMRLRESGDAMPWENRGGATTPPPPPPSA